MEVILILISTEKKLYVLTCAQLTDELNEINLNLEKNDFGIPCYRLIVYNLKLISKTFYKQFWGRFTFVKNYKTKL